MEWSLSQRKYQLWLATPSRNRPKGLQTREDVALQLGLPEDALQTWECSAGWWDDTFEAARAIIGHRLADILESTVSQAIKGNVPAQKLAYTILGVAAEHVDHKIQLEDDRLVIVMQHMPGPVVPKVGSGPVEP